MMVPPMQRYPHKRNGLGLLQPLIQVVSQATRYMLLVPRLCNFGHAGYPSLKSWFQSASQCSSDHDIFIGVFFIVVDHNFARDCGQLA